MGLLLGVYEGRLALWLDDDPKPARIFSLSVESLPAEDQYALRRGISIQSSEDLARVLEDFLS